MLAHKEAEQIFREEAPDLAASGFVRGFAGGLSILEIKKTLPSNMIPESAYPIFDKMIAKLNEEADSK